MVTNTAGERSAEDLTARARIRDAALRLFAERGTDGATIRDIAKAAGVSGGLGAIFTTVPVTNLLIILVGMPLAAAVGGWIFAGRQPHDLGHQPLE